MRRPRTTIPEETPSSVPSEIVDQLDVLRWTNQALRQLKDLPSGKLRDLLHANLNTLLTNEKSLSLQDANTQLARKVEDQQQQIRSLERKLQKIDDAANDSLSPSPANAKSQGLALWFFFLHVFFLGSMIKLSLGLFPN